MVNCLEFAVAKFIPNHITSTEHMEYVMFNVDDREEIVIESETEIKSAVIRPLSAGISFESKFWKDNIVGGPSC